MIRAIFNLALLLALLLAAGGRSAWALGEERFGNEALNEANYTDWPGIMPVVNHPSRVYWWWVNGNEAAHYRGDVAALNETLQRFAEAKSEGREVVLRPGPGVVHSFNREQTIPFGWQLHLVGGIARHQTTLDRGDRVWPKHPVLTIYLGGEIELEKIRFPPGLKVVSIDEVKKRTREGLKSENQNVRGWANGVLAALDPYDPESRDAIAGMLKDKENWVRLNAALALPTFGKKAQAALPILRAAMETDDARLKETVQKSIEAIEQAEDTSAAERAHQESLQQIRRFLDKRRG